MAIVLSHQLRKAEGGGPTATTTVCPLPPRPRPLETAETGLVSAGAFYQTRVGCQAVTITNTAIQAGRGLWGCILNFLNFYLEPGFVYHPS